MHLKEEKMHKHFCKICYTSAPQGAIANPTIIFINEDNYAQSLTVHFDCIDKEIVGQWNSMTIPNVFQGKPIKSIVLANCGTPGLKISHSDFTVLEEAWDQDGNKGVKFKKVAANILAQKIIELRKQGTTEEPQHSIVPESGTHFAPMAATA